MLSRKLRELSSLYGCKRQWVLAELLSRISLGPWLPFFKLRYAGSRSHDRPHAAVCGLSKINKQSVKVFCASVSFSLLPLLSLRSHESRYEWGGRPACQAFHITVMRASADRKNIISIIISRPNVTMFDNNLLNINLLLKSINRKLLFLIPSALLFTLYQNVLLYLFHVCMYCLVFLSLYF